MANPSLGRSLLVGRNLVECAHDVAKSAYDVGAIRELIVGDFANSDIEEDELMTFFTQAFDAYNWCRQAEDHVYAAVTRQAIIASILPKLYNLGCLKYHNFCHLPHGEQQAKTVEKLRARFGLPEKLRHILIACHDETGQVSFPITQMASDSNVCRLTICKATAINLPLQDYSTWQKLEILELLDCDIPTLDSRALVGKSPNVTTLSYTQSNTYTWENCLSTILKSVSNRQNSLETLYIRSCTDPARSRSAVEDRLRLLKHFSKLRFLRLSQLSLGFVKPGINSNRLNLKIRRSLPQDESIIHLLPETLQVLRIDDADLTCLPQLFLIPALYKLVLPKLQRIEPGIGEGGTIQKRLQKALRSLYVEAGLELKFRRIDTPHRPWRIDNS